MLFVGSPHRDNCSVCGVADQKFASYLSDRYNVIDMYSNVMWRASMSFALTIAIHYRNIPSLYLGHNTLQ